MKFSQISVKHLVFYFVGAHIFNLVFRYWVADVLYKIINPTTESEILSFINATERIGLLIEASTLVAIVWLVVKGVLAIRKKLYK